MILLLDAGNTRIKWGLWHEDVWLERGSCPTGELARLKEDLAGLAPHRAMLCCVAAEAICHELERILAPRVERLAWVQPLPLAHGLRNHYQPGLGGDRYAALVAALRRGLGDCVVVNVGTALTVDALTADGQFLGGAIAPGPALMQRALLQGTAKVRDISGEIGGFPTDTGAAVACGIALAQAGVVLGMRERLARHRGGEVAILVGGGARAGLISQLSPPVLEAEDLVLEGMAWMAKESIWER